MQRINILPISTAGPTVPPGIGCVQTPRPHPGIGLTLIFLPIIQNKNYVTIDQCFHGQKQKGIL